ncbi:MAG: ABC transporter permease, partial [Polyangiales bacterium]
LSPRGLHYHAAGFARVTNFPSIFRGVLHAFLSGPVSAGANPRAHVARAEQEVTGLLRERHHLMPGQDDDFSVRNLTEIASAQSEGTKTMTTLLASVAAVSLLVGGIGIMNIMLVSVTERTREIGLRMAIGAKPRHILAQFLVEALALSIVGGMIGVLLGTVGAKELSARFGWSTLIRPDVTLIAVLFSAMVGVVFGMYPARKASRLDPIQALRFE